MKTEITEIIKNNYAVDFSSMGTLVYDKGVQDIEEMIEQDITENFNDVIHLSSLVKIKESINLEKPSHLSINLYMKVLDSDYKEDILQLIASYISKTFLK